MHRWYTYGLFVRGKDEFSNCGMSHLLKRSVDTYNNIILGRVNSASSKVWYDGSMALPHHVVLFPSITKPSITL